MNSETEDCPGSSFPGIVRQIEARVAAKSWERRDDGQAGSSGIKTAPAFIAAIQLMIISIELSIRIGSGSPFSTPAATSSRASRPACWLRSRYVILSSPKHAATRSGVAAACRSIKPMTVAPGTSSTPAKRAPDCGQTGSPCDELPFIPSIRLLLPSSDPAPGRQSDRPLPPDRSTRARACATRNGRT